MGLIFTVDYYELSDGTAPTLEAFATFERVSPKLRDAVLAGIEKLGDQANHSGTLTEQISPRLWCLRVRFNGNCARIFFTFAKGAKIYLLNGYVKKSNKIPVKELKRATSLLINFQQRGINA